LCNCLADVVIAIRATGVIKRAGRPRSDVQRELDAKLNAELVVRLTWCPVDGRVRYGLSVASAPLEFSGTREGHSRRPVLSVVESQLI
jgi:hypothetical protein